MKYKDLWQRGKIIGVTPDEVQTQLLDGTDKISCPRTRVKVVVQRGAIPPPPHAVKYVIEGDVTGLGEGETLHFRLMGRDVEKQALLQQFEQEWTPT